MLPSLYRGLTRPLAPLVIVYLKRRRRRGREDALRFQERQGIPGKIRPRGPLVWIHAASVGEATAMLALIERLGAKAVSVYQYAQLYDHAVILFSDEMSEVQTVIERRLPQLRVIRSSIRFPRKCEVVMVSCESP